MKTEKEVLKIAKELCQRQDTECAVFITGFLKGWEMCLNEMGYELDREKNN